MFDEYDDYPQDSVNDKSVTLATEVTVEWSNQGIIAAAIERVSQLIYNEIKPTVVEKISASLDDLANETITAMFDREVQLTDRWGDPRGTPISIRAMLQRDAEKWLTDVVDYQGRRGSDSYGDKNPRIHWLFQEALNGKKDHRGKTELQKMVTKSIKSVVGDVTADVEKIVKAQARKALGLK